MLLDFVSTSKLIGTAAGAIAGGIITVLLEIAVLKNTSVPGTVVAAVFIGGVFIGALLGSIIGKDDRLKLAVTVVEGSEGPTIH